MPEQAGQVYRWRMVQASTMKWMDVTFNGTGCHFGIYARDGNFLRDFPRLTDHIVMSAANRSPSLPCHFCCLPRTPFSQMLARKTPPA